MLIWKFNLSEIGKLHRWIGGDHPTELGLNNTIGIPSFHSLDFCLLFYQEKSKNRDLFKKSV
jgi:hypothetical protein